MKIPNNWKEEYLKQILDKNLVKDTLISYLLNFIVNNEIILNNLHFVQKAQFTSRGLVFNRISDTTHVSLYLDGYRIAKPSLIYQKLNQTMKEPLYIEFKNFKIDKIYAKVYENNPYLNYEEEYSQFNRDYVDLFISLHALEFEEEKILNEIENVLDLNNKEKFEDLSNEYQRIQISKQMYLDEVEIKER